MRSLFSFRSHCMWNRCKGYENGVATLIQLFLRYIVSVWDIEFSKNICILHWFYAIKFNTTTTTKQKTKEKWERNVFFLSSLLCTTAKHTYTKLNKSLTKFRIEIRGNSILRLFRKFHTVNRESSAIKGSSQFIWNASECFRWMCESIVLICSNIGNRQSIASATPSRISRISSIRPLIICFSNFRIINRTEPDRDLFGENKTTINTTREATEW